MKLYFAPRTKATRARWLLEELELPYELVRVDVGIGENRSPGYLDVSPLGELPALIDGKVRLFESAAICLYLADLRPEKKLAPPVGSPDRAAYYQWLLFAETTLEPVLMHFHRHALLPEAQRAAQQATLEPHRGRLAEVLDVLDARIAGRECIVGYDFTAADLVLTSVLHIGTNLKLLDGYPRLVEYVHRHTRRNAVLKAMDRPA